jgi:uracil-DNA glycosylase family 4
MGLPCAAWDASRVTDLGRGHAQPIDGLAAAAPIGPARAGSWPDDPATARTPVARDAGDVRRLAGSAPSLSHLDARISVCRACPRLLEWREEVATVKRASFAAEPYWGRPIPGYGEERPAVVVLGLAPAAHGGNRTGRVFTGDRSADWLLRAMHRAGLASQPTSTHVGDGLRLPTARMLAAVRCAPPANKPTPAERDTCAPWLVAELRALKPTTKVVVALGHFAWRAAFPALREAGCDVPATPPRFGHGVVAAGSPTVIASYHPSQQNTFTGVLTEAMLDDLFATAVTLSTA